MNFNSGRIILFPEADISMGEKITKFVNTQTNSIRYISADEVCDLINSKNSSPVDPEDVAQTILTLANTGCTVFAKNNKSVVRGILSRMKLYGGNVSGYEIFTTNAELVEEFKDSENLIDIRTISEEEELSENTFIPKQTVIVYIMPTETVETHTKTITEKSRYSIDIDAIKEAFNITEDVEDIGIIVPQLITASYIDYSKLLTQALGENGFASGVFFASKEPSTDDPMTKIVFDMATARNIPTVVGEDTLVIKEIEEEPSEASNTTEDEIPSVDAEIVSE